MDFLRRVFGRPAANQTARVARNRLEFMLAKEEPIAHSSAFVAPAKETPCPEADTQKVSVEAFKDQAVAEIHKQTEFNAKDTEGANPLSSSRGSSHPSSDALRAAEQALEKTVQGSGLGTIRDVREPVHQPNKEPEMKEALEQFAKGIADVGKRMEGQALKMPGEPKKEAQINGGPKLFDPKKFASTMKTDPKQTAANRSKKEANRNKKEANKKKSEAGEWSVRRVRGVGAVREAQLAALGVRTVRALAEADPALLAGVPRAPALQLAARALL